jgi:hypothetical protein
VRIDEDGIRWKVVNGYPNYEVSEDGRVLNAQRQTMMKISGYSRASLHLTLSVNGVQATHYVHRLVAEHFLEGFDPTKPVKHIRGTIDNRVSNLTQEMGPQTDGYPIRWKTIEEAPNYLIGSHGRVYNRKNGIYIKHFLREGRYSVEVRVDGERKNFFVHSLMEKYFSSL